MLYVCVYVCCFIFRFLIVKQKSRSKGLLRDFLSRVVKVSEVVSDHGLDAIGRSRNVVDIRAGAVKIFQSELKISHRCVEYIYRSVCAATICIWPEMALIVQSVKTVGA